MPIPNSLNSTNPQGKRRLHQRLSGDNLITFKFNHVVIPMIDELNEGEVLSITSEKVKSAAKTVAPFVTLISGNLIIQPFSYKASPPPTLSYPPPTLSSPPPSPPPPSPPPTTNPSPPPSPPTPPTPDSLSPPPPSPPPVPISTR